MFHEKGTGLSFLVLGGKLGNQEQGQVSGCLVSAAVVLLPFCRQLQMPTSPGQAKKCPWLLASTDCLNCPSLSPWGKRTWAKEVGDVDLRHEPDTEWAKGPLHNFV